MNADFTVTDLTCEYLTNPLGVEADQPRLAWKLRGDRRGLKQSAYQIRAAGAAEALAEGRNLLWDSGRVESDQSVHVPYSGPVLDSRQCVWWDVQVWDENGEAALSGPAYWEMGLLKRADWRAEWIGSALVGGKHVTSPAPYLRRGFTLDEGVARARLYVTALGLYECSINGQRVTDDVFAPGWTNYRKRVQYQVYDVTNLLKPGENVIGAVLGDGWYCGYVAWHGRQNYGDRPKLLAQLEVEHADGTRTVITSDDAWCWQTGPVIESDFLMGESCDARRELPGWDAPGYDDSGWHAVERFDDPSIAISARRGPAVKKIMELKPIAEPVRVGNKHWGPTQWLFDLGQNMVGWARLKAQAPPGTTVTLRFAEILNPDGTPYYTNLRSARATDYYTFKGEGEEVYEPRFTFHGFRYVEVIGLPEPPTKDTLTGIVVHSEMPITGKFECSDPLLNQLQHNIQWGQRGNFVDVPTDCPQRDERLGWTGDAQVFIRTAAFNMNVASFFTKWVQDLEDSQSAHGQIPPIAPRPNPGPTGDLDGGPAWADAFIICPWTIYLCFGDRAVLAEHYPAMKRYVDHLLEMSHNKIRCHPDTEYKHGDWRGFGDWLSINAETPHDLIGTAFLVHDARLLAKMAGLLGFSEDETRYRAAAEEIRQAFLRRYVTEDGLVASGSQTAYVLALHFDLLPEELRQNAAAELVRDIRARKMHLSTGFVGAPYLNHALVKTGKLDTAYDLLHQTSWPSWLYSVTQGATTIWERWDGWTHDKGFQDPSMNSFNHYAYGSIGDWLYQVVAGINVDPENPGYKHIILQPMPGGDLSHARAEYESLYGKIVSAWKRDGDCLEWQVIVPPNTEATLFFPRKDGQQARVDGQVVDGQRLRVGSGRYEVVIG